MLVAWACSPAIAAEELQESAAVGWKGWHGFEGFFVVHSSSIRCVGQERAHVRVVCAHLQCVDCRPCFANLSACSLPGMLWCDRVHFLRTLQPLSRSVPSTSRHFLMYSLPLLRPPARACNVFWLSGQRKIHSPLLIRGPNRSQPSCIP